jgi:uncharacterized caspase-like protein
MRLLHALSLLLALVFCGIGPAGAAGRVALVIGNGAYEQAGRLANPVRDAEAMAVVLETLGFDVILRTDVDRRGADQAMDEFIRAADGAELALFYFAGHGIQIGGENFILPTDVSAESEWSLRSSAIEAQRVVSEMERLPGVSIAILDACRDNPLVDAIASTSRSVGASRGLGRMRLTGRGAIIAFAAAAGDTAADGSGEHSPFTAALLKEIGEPNVEVGLMFRRVARRVRDETSGEQQPELLVRLVDEVYLNGTAPPVTVAASKPVGVQPATASADETSAAVEAKAQAQAADATSGTDTVVDALPEEETAAADGNRRSPAPGRIASYDTRFFGDRVIHMPAWVTGVDVPAPLGWQSHAPAALGEADGNDSFAYARPVPLAAAVETRITPRGDYDWFKVQVPTAGELRIDVDPAPAELDLYARILNADNEVTAGWQGAPAARHPLGVSYELPGPGAYWIQLGDGNNNAESSTSFVTYIDFTAADDPLEPNDTIGAAAPIPATTTFWPTIYPRGDIDWYKIWVPEPGLLQLTASNVDDKLDIYMRVLDLNEGTVMGWVGPARQGGDTVADAELSAPGTYLIQVSDGNNDASSVKPFKFEAAFRPVSDPAEPNNSVSEAVIVPPTSEWKAAIFPRGDTDWLAIDVDHPGELTLWASNSPEELDIHVRVQNADAKDVLGWTGPARQGGDVVGVADLPAPGRYFINVVDGNNNASSPELFDLSLTYIAQPDQYEPNNGPAEAAPLTLGGQIAFNILPRGDNDWFRFEVPSAGELAVVIEEVADNLDIYFQVFDADRKAILGWTGPPREGAVTEGIADLPAPGIYYLQIADGNNNARSIKHATLSTAFTPIAESSEPNDSFSQAAPIELGVPYLATILPRGDQDWYLLKAPRAGSFVVTVDEVDENLDIYVRLHDAEGQGGSWYGPPREGAVTEAEIAVPAPGYYRLLVADGNNNARSAKPYRLVVDFN